MVYTSQLPKICWQTFVQACTGWNDKIVALEKTTWFHFRLMKTGFLFFVAGQLYTNLKSDRSLLSCLKVTQCSTSEIGDALLYNLCSLPIQVMTTGPLPAPTKCKSRQFNVPRVMKTNFPATVMVFGVVSSEGHIMPPYIFEVGLKVYTKVYLDVLKSLVIPGAIRWSVADPGCGSRIRRRPTSPKRPWLGFRRSATTLYPFLTGPPPPPTWTRWTTSFSHTSRTSLTWPSSTPKSAWSPPSAEYSLSSRRRLWKSMLPIPDPYRGGDWGWRRLHLIDVSSTK